MYVLMFFVCIFPLCMQSGMVVTPDPEERGSSVPHDGLDTIASMVFSSQLVTTILQQQFNIDRILERVCGQGKKMFDTVVDAHTASRRGQSAVEHGREQTKMARKHAKNAARHANDIGNALSDMSESGRHVIKRKIVDHVDAELHATTKRLAKSILSVFLSLLHFCDDEEENGNEDMGEGDGTEVMDKKTQNLFKKP